MPLGFTLVAVGKLREKPFRAMADEYLKRLSRFGKTEEIELPDLPEPQDASPAQEKQVKDITVRELADLVDVNRGTFYLYYRDIFDMLDSIEQELFEQLNHLIEAHKGEPVLTHALPVLQELFHLIEDNQDICRVLLSENGDMKFLEKLSDVVQREFRTDWLAGVRTDEIAFDYSYAFGALGFIGLLRTWLNRNCAEKADDMARLADKLIRQGLTSGLVK